jgi:endonuclease/exonuclease/phosphatase family metal-dependent hydrolase
VRSVAQDTRRRFFRGEGASASADLLAKGSTVELPVVFNERVNEWVPVEDVRALSASPQLSVCHELRLVTWNVMFDRYSGQPTPLGMPGIDWCSPQRYPVLCKVLAETDGDVIALQEVEPPFWEALSKQDWVRRNYVLSCGPSGSAINPWGVLVLIHKHRVQVANVTHLNVAGWSGHVALMPVVTVTNLPHGRPMHIVAVHLLAPFTRAQENARTTQDAALRQHLMKGHLSHGDCVCLGDFNDWPANEFTMPPETRFEDFWTRLHPDDPGKTMDDTNTFCKLKIEEVFFGRSDKIFVRGGGQWVPKRATLIGRRSVNEECGNNHAPAYLFPSDHYGVEMIITHK